MPEKKNNPFPVMENMTVKMLKEYLRDKQSIIMPLGIIEQHGYHLPLKTDALIATHLGRMIGERTGILVAPTMYESFSGGGCPGTINISPATMSLVVSDRLISLASQGFRNFYLFLCHGGSENSRALDNALKMLLRNNSLFENSMVVLLPCLEWSVKGREIVKRRGDWHSGLVETSMVMALEPELVRLSEMEVDEEPMRSFMIEHPDNYQHAEKIVDSPHVVPRLRQRPDIKVGVMGYPEEANAELGREINEEIVANASKEILDLESKADGIYKEVDFKPEPLIVF